MQQMDPELHFIDSIIAQVKKLELEGVIAERLPSIYEPEKRGAHRMDEKKMKTFRWAKPKVMAEVAFNNRTTQGHLRDSCFLHLRPDKSFGGCTKERAQ